MCLGYSRTHDDHGRYVGDCVMTLRGYDTAGGGDSMQSCQMPLVAECGIRA